MECSKAFYSLTLTKVKLNCYGLVPLRICPSCIQATRLFVSTSASSDQRLSYVTLGCDSRPSCQCNHTSFAWRKLASFICTDYVTFVNSSAMISQQDLIVAALDEWSRLDYCNAVLACLSASTLRPVQRVLHAAARIVFNLKPRDHVTPALQELHWLPVAERIQSCKLCLLVHKTMLGVTHAGLHRRPADAS